MKPLLTLVLAALTLAACSEVPLGKMQDRRNDPGQRPYPASPAR